MSRNMNPGCEIKHVFLPWVSHANDNDDGCGAPSTSDRSEKYYSVDLDRTTSKSESLCSMSDAFVLMWYFHGVETRVSTLIFASSIRMDFHNLMISSSLLLRGRFVWFVVVSIWLKNDLCNHTTQLRYLFL